MLKTFYVCYFGIREPLVQTQVLPYLRELSRAGIEVKLLTFEPRWKEDWPESARESQRKQLSLDGLDWNALAYHKSPVLLGTLFDILAGAYLVRQVTREQKIDVLHARSHTPLAMALLVKRLTGVKLIFDLRGLMAEEYADSGIWKEGSLVFRVVKWLEERGIENSNQIVVLTRKMRDWLMNEKGIESKKIEVIPCCVDLTNYSWNRGGVAHKRADRSEAIYCGSVTGLYLLEEMGRFFIELKKLKSDAFLRILSKSPAAETGARLQAVGLREGDYDVGSGSPAEVARLVEQAQLGLSFRKATFSQIAASPTKIPEYLAAGIPVVCHAGVGDFDGLVTDEGVGVIVNGLTQEDYAKAARQIVELLEDENLSQRCYAVAIRNFDLKEVGGRRYLNVYGRLDQGRK